MDAIHTVETVILSVAVTLLPALTDTGVITATAATIAGAVITGIATGLHLPAGVDAVASRRAGGGVRGVDTSQVEDEISAVAERILARLRPPAPAAADPHGDRPNS